MKNIIVSACLLGAACRYDGLSKPCDNVIKLKDKYNLIPVCAEVFGGLPTPRVPCEISGDRVINKIGEDKTAEYRRGADEVLRLAELFGVDTAVLKERSPSCGCGEIYSGDFSGSLISGDGILASLLKKNGFKIYGETQLRNGEL